MRLREALLAFVLVAAAPVCSLAEPSGASAILGTWKTPKNDGKVVIEPCGSAICARVIDGRQLRANPQQADVNNPDPEKRSRKILGLHILEGYTGGPTEWSGGEVYDPQTGDSSHNSTLTLEAPGTLVVKGCRLVFCRSETWTKIAARGE
ncbi:MAG: DUF2147 domain-containing protein [Alphaproteobacteria bacterium]|nr:DUF2147 domain-containing protein [Alphaproteobacteria bacterium]